MVARLDLVLEFFVDTNVFHPQNSERANSKPHVLICDGFSTHESLGILGHCFANKITFCHLPFHTSHKLQPCDISVFAPLKTAHCDDVERLEHRGVNTVGYAPLFLFPSQY